MLLFFSSIRKQADADNWLPLRHARRACVWFAGMFYELNQHYRQQTEEDTGLKQYGRLIQVWGKAPKKQENDTTAWTELIIDGFVLVFQ